MATKVVATQKARNKQDKDNLYYKIDKQKDEISIDLHFWFWFHGYHSFELIF